MLIYDKIAYALRSVFPNSASFYFLSNCGQVRGPKGYGRSIRPSIIWRGPVCPHYEGQWVPIQLDDNSFVTPAGIH